MNNDTKICKLVFCHGIKNKQANCNFLFHNLDFFLQFWADIYQFRLSCNCEKKVRIARYKLKFKVQIVRLKYLYLLLIVCWEKLRCKQRKKVRIVCRYHCFLFIYYVSETTKNKFARFVRRISEKKSELQDINSEFLNKNLQLREQKSELCDLKICNDVFRSYLQVI